MYGAVMFKLVSEYVTANTVQNNFLSRDRHLILPYCLQIGWFYFHINSSIILQELFSQTGLNQILLLIVYTMPIECVCVWGGGI